jgi:hypothetical protein
MKFTAPRVTVFCLKVRQIDFGKCYKLQTATNSPERGATKTPMKEITYQLECARTVIRNLVGSHQATPEAAVDYAYSQIQLPADTRQALLHYAKQTAKAN